MASEGAPEVMEKGDVFFFYRPKVGVEDPGDLDDVQRSMMILRTGDVARLLMLGRKKLPDPTQHSRPYWGFVEAVTDDVASLKPALAAEDYGTATRGERHRPAARAAGQGCYALVKHGARKGGRATSAKTSVHIHFVYRLQLPKEWPREGSPQDQMNLAPQASYILQVKNPLSGATSASRHVPSRRTDPFPKHLQDEMGSLRFVPCDPPDFLNNEGCEFLLISPSDDVPADFGGEVMEELQHGCEELEGGDKQILGLLEDSEKDKGSLIEPLFEETWA